MHVFINLFFIFWWGKPIPIMAHLNEITNEFFSQLFVKIMQSFQFCITCFINEFRDGNVLFSFSISRRSNAVIVVWVKNKIESVRKMNWTGFFAFWLGICKRKPSNLPYFWIPNKYWNNGMQSDKENKPPCFSNKIFSHESKFIDFN